MEKFQVQLVQEEPVAVLRLAGYLDAHTAPEFEKALQNLINKKQYRIVVDLEELKYISSAGLGVFMGFIEEVRQHQGDIRICSVSPRVYKVFDLLGFPTLYQFYPDRQQALASFQSDQPSQDEK